MMDYKELIERLKEINRRPGMAHWSTCAEAVVAIETLLAEREATVRRGICEKVFESESNYCPNCDAKMDLD